MTELLPTVAHQEHVAQTNIYNILRQRNGLPAATRIAIDYISMKGERIIEVPIWTSAEVETYIISKLTPVIESLLSKPPQNNAEWLEVEIINSENDESWLPPKLDPNDKVRGWKCRYCNHAASRCWPEGVPGADKLAQAKQAASGAARRAFFANLNSGQTKQE